MQNTPISTHKFRLLLLAILCCSGNVDASSPQLWKKKVDNTPRPAHVLVLPPFPPYQVAVDLPLYHLLEDGNWEVPPIYEDVLTAFMDDPLEAYDSWDESLVNPYGVRLVDMKDTVKIDIRGYIPPSQKHVTSDFGDRRGGFHYGIDLKVYKGDSIYCAFDGQVRLTKYQRRGYGYYVVVRHNNGLETLYAHLSKTLVTPGQDVKAGEVLGMAGSTGRSTGYHLHFETRYLGNVINPNDLFNFDTPGIKREVFWLSAQNFNYVKELEKVRYWTVRSGDSLSRIASRTGTSVSRLCSLNKLTTKSVLRIGQKIRYS